MLRCQFLGHVLKALFFLKVALKLIYICKNMHNFRALRAPPPDPCLQQLGALLPDPHWPPLAGGPPPDSQNRPPIANFWLRSCAE